MATQLTGRERRRFRIRKKISGSTERPRLSVYRTATHIYAQVVVDSDGTTLAAASTLSRDLKTTLAASELSCHAYLPLPLAALPALRRMFSPR